MANQYIYRRPFDYRVFRNWIMPAPTVAIQITESVTAIESVLGGLEGEIALAFNISDTISVSEDINVFLPILTIFIVESEIVLPSEFVDANTGALTISESDTITVVENTVVQPIETFEGAGFLTMRIGG